MSKENKRYKENRERVYDIYGIPKKERGTKYNMHHIVFREQFKDGFNWYDMNCKGNLYPLTKTEHLRLHQKIALKP